MVDITEETRPKVKFISADDAIDSPNGNIQNQLFVISEESISHAIDTI